ALPDAMVAVDLYLVDQFMLDQGRIKAPCQRLRQWIVEANVHVRGVARGVSHQSPRSSRVLEDGREPRGIFALAHGVASERVRQAAIDQDHLHIGFSDQRTNEGPRASQVQVRGCGALVPTSVVRIEVADVDVPSRLMALVRTQPPASFGTEVSHVELRRAGELGMHFFGGASQIGQCYGGAPAWGSAP